MTTSTRRWNVLGIKQRLADHDEIHSDEACNDILSNVGGWPLLLDVLFDKCREKGGPRQCAQTIKESLNSPETDLFRSFKQGLGIDVHPSVFHVLKFIQNEGEVLREFIIPDFLGDLALSLKDCETALEYLQRMGCVDFYKDKDTFQVEPTIKRILIDYESPAQ